VSVHFAPYCLCPRCDETSGIPGQIHRDPIGGLVGITGREFDRLKDAEKERDALKARVAELEHMEMFTRCQHTCATSGCTETGVSGVCGKCTVTVMHERDALAAKLAEVEADREKIRQSARIVEAMACEAQTKLAIAVEALRAMDYDSIEPFTTIARSALAKLGEK